MCIDADVKPTASYPNLIANFFVKKIRMKTRQRNLHIASYFALFVFFDYFFYYLFFYLFC